MSETIEWCERYRLYEHKCEDAQRIQTEPERTEAFDDCQKTFQELLSARDCPITEPDWLQINSIEQLLAWCDSAQSVELFPLHLRRVRDMAETLGIRVKLPVLFPKDVDLFFRQDDELSDSWKNIVFEFIESIQIAVEKLPRNKREFRKKDRSKKPTANELMRKEVLENPESGEWPKSKWSETIGKSETAIQNAEMWKALESQRLLRDAKRDQAKNDRGRRNDKKG